jgi:hypothetical protein
LQLHYWLVQNQPARRGEDMLPNAGFIFEVPAPSARKLADGIKRRWFGSLSRMAVAASGNEVVILGVRRPPHSMLPALVGVGRKSYRSSANILPPLGLGGVLIPSPHSHRAPALSTTTGVPGLPHMKRARCPVDGAGPPTPCAWSDTTSARPARPSRPANPWCRSLR